MYSSSRARIIRPAIVLMLVVAFTLVASSALAIGPGDPMHRFYNVNTGSHFYTANEDEKSDVISKLSDVYVYEGVAWDVFSGDFNWGEQVYVQKPVYRFYNVKNGSHFYTISEAEKDKVIAKLSSVYTFEGVAFEAFGAEASSFMSPVYRFYNKLNGSHFYTIDESEKDMVKLLYPAVYKFEGIAFSTPDRMRF